MARKYVKVSKGLTHVLARWLAYLKLFLDKLDLLIQSTFLLIMICILQTLTSARDQEFVINMPHAQTPQAHLSVNATRVSVETDSSATVSRLVDVDVIKKF